MFTIYGLYDKINKSYIEMMVCKSEVEARSIADGMVNYSNSVVRNFPHDFEINELVSIYDSGTISDSVSDRIPFGIQLADFVRKERNNEV